MTEPLNDAGATKLVSREIPAALEAWRSQATDAASRALQEKLYRLCVDLSDKVMGDAAGNAVKEGCQTPRDLAHAFLMEVLEKGTALTVESRSGLKRAIERHWHATRDPAKHELWKTLSAALRELADQGRARRVDANEKSAANRNEARWATAARDVPAPADIAKFERRCEEVPGCLPPEAARWLPDGKTPRKIISPADARELAARLLACADGWVTMGMLFDMFGGKVRLFHSCALGEEENDTFESTLVAAREETFLAVGAMVAKRIWERVESRGLVPVLCRYFLPKHVRDERVRLEDLGATSTVHDQIRQIKAILREELAPEEVVPPDLPDDLVSQRWHGRLVTETLACLETFCDCPPEN